ncbi:MAG TPA: Rrf2 family transcriptional regulator [Bryobacteraceae bacterium]|nr:Rrf2 family transcriptional regulator [Bryobacteraceae bacterium]
MRIISKKTKYGLTALYSLARSYGSGPVMVPTLARQGGIPEKSLEQILLVLKIGGIVRSKAGRGGGYQLTKPPDQITIGSVIRIIEGPLAPLPCASETAYRPCEECPDPEECGTRLLMRQVRDATAHILDRTTLADVCRMVDKKKAVLPL